MKTLTVAQPYATLAAIGAVRIVTLDTFTQYTGPIAIYAPSDFGPGGGMAFYRAVQLRPFRKALRDVAMPLGAWVCSTSTSGQRRTALPQCSPSGKPIRGSAGRDWRLCSALRPGQYKPPKGLT